MWRLKKFKTSVKWENNFQDKTYNIKIRIVYYVQNTIWKTHYI
jgi:hypothetical protein